MQKRDLNHSVLSKIVLKMFVIRQFHCTAQTQCSCCIRADLGTYVPASMRESCHDICTACSFTRLRTVCKGCLGGHVPALKCKSCQDKHGLHVLLLDHAWCTSFGVTAHLGMYMPVTCESCQEQHGLYALLPYCAWCASHCITAHLGMYMPVTCESCQEQHGLYALLPYCAWCASHCITAHLGMYITCLLHVKAARNNKDFTLSYHTVPGVPAIV